MPTSDKKHSSARRSASASPVDLDKLPQDFYKGKHTKQASPPSSLEPYISDSDSSADSSSSYVKVSPTTQPRRQTGIRNRQRPPPPTLRQQMQGHIKNVTSFFKNVFKGGKGTRKRQRKTRKTRKTKKIHRRPAHHATRHHKRH